MNYDIINGLIRSLSPVLVAWLIKRGLTPADAGNLATYGGDAIIALVTFAVGTWTVMRNKEKGQIAQTAALPGVKTIEVNEDAVPAGGFDAVTAAKVKVTPVSAEHPID